MSTPAASPRPRLADFWHDLSRDGRLLLSTVAVDALGTGLVLPFAVVYLHDVRHIPLGTVGTVIAVPAMVALLLLGPVGSIIDRLGPRRVQLVALVAQLVGSALLAGVHTASEAALAFAFIGVGQAAFWPASQSLVAAVVPSAIRQRYFGVNFTLLNAGIGLGGLVAGLVVTTRHPWSFSAVYLADAASFLVPIAVLALPLRHVGNATTHAAHPTSAPADDDAPAGAVPAAGYLAVLQDRVFRSVLVITFFSAFVGYAQMEAGWTAYARTVADASTRVIGFAFAANTAVIVLLQLVVLQRIEGRSRTRALMLMSGIWAVAWTLMGVTGLVPGTAVASVLLVVSLGVFGLGETLLSPVGAAVTNDLAPDHLRGRYNAVNSAVFQVAAIVGPIAAGHLLGWKMPVVFVGMLLLGCGVMVVLLHRVERVIPASANGVTAPEPASALA
ncbi:MAG TPA: MFS transporter [Actinomycetales bacterium]|nr:MFS transporter [Actinomycetales bacterium]